MGWLQQNVLKMNGSLMFQRNKKQDRTEIGRRIREHAHNSCAQPLLVFPEGTCVNNEYTVLFHKGAFELDAVVCPVAIKYDKTYADPYWNTREQNFIKYMFYLMTRWTVVADVWWLEPQSLLPGESSVQFAERVKVMISEQAGLKNLSWDGYLKNYLTPDKAGQLKETEQNKFGTILRSKMEAEQLQNQPSSNAMDFSRRESEKVTFGAAQTSVNSTGRKRQMRRSKSLAHASIDNEIMPSFPEWMNESNVTDIKNQLMMNIQGSDRPMQMIDHINRQTEGIVKQWKAFTKLRNSEDNARRMENTSWRLWFKQRNELAQRRQNSPVEVAEDIKTPPLFRLTSFNEDGLSSPQREDYFDLRPLQDSPPATLVLSEPNLTEDKDLGMRAHLHEMLAKRPRPTSSRSMINIRDHANKSFSIGSKGENNDPHLNHRRRHRRHQQNHRNRSDSFLKDVKAAFVGELCEDESHGGSSSSSSRGSSKSDSSMGSNSRYGEASAAQTEPAFTLSGSESELDEGEKKPAEFAANKSTLQWMLSSSGFFNEHKAKPIYRSGSAILLYKYKKPSRKRQ